MRNTRYFKVEGLNRLSFNYEEVGTFKACGPKGAVRKAAKYLKAAGREHLYVTLRSAPYAF